MKSCSSCNQHLPFSSFSPDNSKKTGYSSLCKPCKRERYSTRYHRAYRSKKLQDNYGITADDYDRMLEDQGHRCAICNSTKTGRNDTWFCVDHDHTTGKVRGLLCNTCNRGLGLFKDDPTVLTNAINYLNA